MQQHLRTSFISPRVRLLSRLLLITVSIRHTAHVLVRMLKSECVLRLVNRYSTSLFIVRVFLPRLCTMFRCTKCDYTQVSAKHSPFNHQWKPVLPLHTCRYIFRVGVTQISHTLMTFRRVYYMISIRYRMLQLLCQTHKSRKTWNVYMCSCRVMLCFYAVYQFRSECVCGVRVVRLCLWCGRACVWRGVGVGVPVSVRGAADGGARSVGGASSLLSATGLPRSCRVEP